MSINSNTGNFLRSGAIAGAISSFLFVIVHDVWISDIWSSLPIMLIAGALCGLCLGWTYDVVVREASAFSWVRYNTIFVVMFILLGVVSVVVYDPITTVAVLIENNEPPGELIGKAMPMTIVFTLAAAGMITTTFDRRWSNIGPVLVTCIVLVLTLGLNVSIIGFVAFPSGTLYLIVELFGLIAALGVVYAIAFGVLERRALTQR